MKAPHHSQLSIPLLLLSLSAQADIECDPSLMGCGLQFTTIPATPSLVSGSSVTSSAYVITNVSSVSTPLTSVTLVRQSDDTVGTGAVTIDSSTTCTSNMVLSPSATCDIYLDFNPASTGLLDWNLIVTPNSSQRPLILDITTTVTAPSIYSVTGGYYLNTAGSNYGLLTLSSDAGTTWNYGIDGTSLTSVYPDGFDPTSAQTTFVISSECSSSLCILGGSYNAGSAPLIATNGGEGNTWSYPVDSSGQGTVLPASFNYAQFSSVSCADDQSICVAAGSYVSGSDVYPMLLTNTDQHGLIWNLAIDQNNLPSDFVPGFFGAYATFSSVDCTPSICVAVGIYTSSTTGTTEPMIAFSTNVGATWNYVPTSSITVTADDYTGLLNMNSVSCSASASTTSGVCITGGGYYNGGSNLGSG